MAKTGLLEQYGPSWTDGLVFGMVWPRRALLTSTSRLGQTAWFWPGMAKTSRLDQYGPSWTKTAWFCLRRPTPVQMEADIPHPDDVAVPLDAETLVLSQHQWLQFEPDTAASIRCRRILRMNVETPRCIDWGLLADAGQAERARAILGEDTPWTRLFDTVDLPTYRLITVEFLSTFRYRAHQAAVREQEDEELPPNIEFLLCGQHMGMSIERFVVLLGIYYEPKTVTDAFIQGLMQGEDGVMRACLRG
ncbi:hypothetical protein E3N88_02074 [Mikania micrantha]|uniref:Uncharacterized protein n=1 Tax=Mikania micrantha TaxID=192012 RepID=A0A5N6Q537_9ASTR|nr:hypothetical protein E3N88_02074 [Mikania micrantha]